GLLANHDTAELCRRAFAADPELATITLRTPAPHPHDAPPRPLPPQPPPDAPTPPALPQGGARPGGRPRRQTRAADQ
ncbi:hypothetical protein OK006_6923, partial [Actinobacteria bacterium OK006]